MSVLRILYVCAFAICFARDPLTVEIPNQGTIIGKVVDYYRTKKIRAYLGIPYAQPPTGIRRFAPPDINPLPAWSDVRNATAYQPGCLQPSNKEMSPFFKLLSSNSEIGYAEDCLYLNIFVPMEKSPPDGFATIIWFHPGNFISGNPSMWDPYTLVYRQKVVVVTFAYRLHILGFFTTIDGEASGNYGLIDQQVAMLWVKANVKLFDGNPDNICLLGYGSGAVSVGIHMAIPSSRDLFNKAIAMSGNFLDTEAVIHPQETRGMLQLIKKRVSCEKLSTANLLQCLRNPSGEDLVRFTENQNFRPIIDAGLTNSSLPLIEKPIRDYFEAGEFNKVPFLTGYTDMEGVLDIGVLQNENLAENFTNEDLVAIVSEVIDGGMPAGNASEGCIINFDHIVSSVLFFYVPYSPINGFEEGRKLITAFKTEKDYGASTFLHAGLASNFNDTYMYRFDIKPTTSAVASEIPEWVTVPHFYDLIYVWGMPYWTDLPDNQEWDNRDKSLSDLVMRLWTNFAKYSDPSKYSPAVNWESFDRADPKLLIIDNRLAMSDDTNVNFKAFEFWNDYFPKVLDVSKQCCNASSASYVSNKLAVAPFFIILDLLR